ncbi:alcohol dehydrogenase catalytic domain-containing protein [Streptomyces sp. NBC_00006]|uniref:alcohol dehydrogenase catalytic domain-containing protein n=1 Tax=Streptomyces sp. NBC_00006 TaxID=2975619 RepID=UPI00225AE082|nr:alcohol dehydrogenase catalytic domain-containing protein [Streptomyces sp. NBC_00006]MCX5529616.1 alcohol dehydrogenase catalytic domain-containing protein [Streptomyces sp. NBC_00006]
MTDHGARPATMKSLVLHGKRDLRLEERPVPSPGRGEVLLAVGSVGVCGSDKHFYTEGRASSDVMTEPFVMGHEFGGRITAVGEGVDEGRVGERVAVEPLVPCGSCRQCTHGEYNICPTQKFHGVPGAEGALQEYVVVPAANAFPIPDSVSDAAAAMVETISVSLWAGERAGITIGESVLITGGGPIGLFALQVARNRGAAHVVLVEPQEARRDLAKSLGAETVASLEEAEGTFDVLMECTGVQQVRHDGCLYVRPGGRAVFIGVGHQDAGVPMPAVIEREVEIRGVMRYRFTWPTVIAGLRDGRFQADDLVTRTLPLEEAHLAWTQAPQGPDVKTIIRVGAQP